MKQIRKKNLDELAEKMQGVSVSEQQNLIGGSFYFDHSGNFVGKYGDGNDIIIANTILHSGISFSIASSETVASVLTTMGKAMGISGNIQLTYGSAKAEYAMHESGQIYFNYNSELIDYNNYYDILSVMHHEHFHQMVYPGYAGTYFQNEYQAFIYQINNPAFQYVSEQFRNYTLQNYEGLHNEQNYGYNSGYGSGYNSGYGSGYESGYF